MNYFIAPRSGEKSYKNFQSTIKHGVPYENIAPHLTPEGKSVLLTEEIIYSWGNRPGTKAQWERMQYGDTVIFYAKGELIMSGEVYFKQQSPSLALAMWPPDENGNPWEYTFFLRNIKYFKIPMKAFNWATGYKSNFIIQGFMQLKGEPLERINRQYESVDEFLNMFKTDISSETPSHSEKLFVNVSDDVEVRFRNEVALRPKQSTEYAIKNAGIARKKIDYAASNKAKAMIGSKGEALVVNEEKKRLQNAGKVELAQKVTRVSVEDDSLGYDILSFDINGAERYIEVKASSSESKGLRFYMSANEMKRSQELNNYYIYFVDAVNTNKPRITPIKCPLNGQFLISTDTYILEAQVE